MKEYKINADKLYKLTKLHEDGRQEVKANLILKLW